VRNHFGEDAFCEEEVSPVCVLVVDSITSLENLVNNCSSNFMSW